MKRRRRLPPLAITLTLLLLTAVSSFADERSQTEKARQAEKPQSFLRLLKDGEGRPLALQTSIVRYRKPNDNRLTVDLIGAVHIGEPAYFQQLNQEFHRYDAVLYELVAPENQRIPRGESQPGNPISALQVGVKSLLELQYQLDGINYRNPKLVHADLSPDEFAKSMADRGESVLQILFRALGQGIAQQSKDPAQSSDLQLLSALFSRNRTIQLRRVLAQQLEQSLSLGNTLFDGPDGSTLVTVRNQRAMDVLESEIRRGRQRVAIFYGAAHLPDMHRRLEKRFGMKRVNERWLTAWKLTASADAP